MLVPPFFNDAPSFAASSLYALVEIPTVELAVAAYSCMRSAEPLKTASTAPIDCSMSPALKIASRPKSKSCTPAKRPPAAVSAPVNALLNLPLDARPADSASASIPLKAPRRFFVASALKSAIAALKPVFSRPNFPATRSVSLPSDAVADSAWCRSPFALLRACA